MAPLNTPRGTSPNLELSHSWGFAGTKFQSIGWEQSHLNPPTRPPVSPKNPGGCRFPGPAGSRAAGVTRGSLRTRIREGPLLAKGCERRMLAAKRRPTRTATATGRRAAAPEGGGREGGRAARGWRSGRGGPGYSLSQDSRLSPSASAILQPPGPALRPQTSRDSARAGPGRGSHGGLRGLSAAVDRRARLCRIPRGRECFLPSSLEETPDVKPTLGQTVQVFIRILSLTHSGALWTALRGPDSGQDGCPRTARRASVVGAGSGSEVCCLEPSRVRRQRVAGTAARAFTGGPGEREGATHKPR